jgi:hypothetical protein
MILTRVSQSVSRDGLRNLAMRLIGVCVAIALAVGVLLVSWRQVATTHQIINNTPAGELVAGRRFGQTFRAPFSGLYRVDVVLATYRRQNRGPVIFHIAEGVGRPEIAAIEIDAAQIQDNAPQRFVFEPVPDSVDREFYFYLEAPDAEKGNAITVWQTDFDSYPSGQAYIDNQPTEGDLRFVAYYRSSPQEVWGILSERIRTWHPLLWQLRWLVAATAAAFVLGCGVLLGEIFVAGSRKNERHQPTSCG